MPCRRAASAGAEPGAATLTHLSAFVIQPHSTQFANLVQVVEDPLNLGLTQRETPEEHWAASLLTPILHP